MSAAATILRKEAAGCPACAAPDHFDEGPSQTSGYRLHRCRDCGLTFSAPMLAADSAWYRSSWLYGLRQSQAAVPGGKFAIPWNFSQALGALPAAPGGRLLDVGCAEGCFLYLAQKAGYEVTGLDFNPASLEIAKALLGNSRIFHSSVEEFGDRFSEKQFHVVTLFEVLEHTANPFQAVRSIHKVLRPGGIFCLSVPGSRRWPRLFHPEVDAPPHHLTLWTEEALKRLLQRSGFRILSVRAKPLQAEDLGFHLRLALHGLVRKFKNRGSNPVRTRLTRALPGQPMEARRRRHEIVKRLAKRTLEPVCWALRLHPNAGGYTLFAHAEKIEGHVPEGEAGGEARLGQ